MTLPIALPNCKQWRPARRPTMGQCLAGHFGGRPSVGTCALCPHREERLSTDAQPLFAEADIDPNYSPDRDKYVGRCCS